MREVLALFLLMITLAPSTAFLLGLNLLMTKHRPSIQDLYPHLTVILICSVLALAIYEIYLFTTNRVPTGKKALWSALLLFARGPAMVVFWYFYVWPDSDRYSTAKSYDDAK